MLQIDQCISLSISYANWKFFWEKHPFAIYMACFCCCFDGSIYFAKNKCCSYMNIHLIWPLSYWYYLIMATHWMRDSILLMQEITVELSDKSFICSLTELAKLFEAKNTALSIIIRNCCTWESHVSSELLCLHEILYPLSGSSVYLQLFYDSS